MSRLAELKQSSHAGIDYEHQIQTGLVQALYEAVEAGHDAQAVAEILDQLSRYSEAHFMSEELLMRLANYDEYDDHVADHIRMMDALEQIAMAHRIGQTAAVAHQAREALDFIQRHIDTRDRRFAEWQV
jgi:hemerythrin